MTGSTRRSILLQLLVTVVVLALVDWLQDDDDVEVFAFEFLDRAFDGAAVAGSAL